MKLIGLTQRVEAVQGTNERRDCLDQMWPRLLVQNEMLPVPLPNFVEDAAALVSKLGLEGVILTGGNDLNHLPSATNAASERDAFERKLLTLCSEKGIPVLGVCRGLQMMAAFYGSELVRLAEHVRTRHGLALCCADSMPLTRRKEVNSFHNFGIAPDKLGTDLIAVAAAPDGSVEALAHRKLRQWGIMWHPERPPYDPNDLTLMKELFG
jgi:gamma-glutamyl-gamma-aminobutyrate hydrolase PuuD